MFVRMQQMKRKLSSGVVSSKKQRKQEKRGTSLSLAQETKHDLGLSVNATAFSIDALLSPDSHRNSCTHKGSSDSVSSIHIRQPYSNSCNISEVLN